MTWWTKRRAERRIPLGTYRATVFRRFLHLSGDETQSHIHVIGKSGSGKSRWLASFYVNLLRAGYTATLIDPHGDLAKLVLQQLVAEGFFERTEAFERLRYLDVPGAAKQGRYLRFNCLRQPYDTHTTTRTVTGSYDPNVKEVRTSSGQSDTQYILGTDNYLDYTIHFQNTGTDTAFTVVVTDTLDATLNMASFQQGTSSHACTVDFLPGRVVRWTFNNILLVDSTTNEAGSHGLTSFRIRLAEPIVPGTLIANAADIFFDFNPPIRTPDALITADFATGLAPAARSTVQLVPNPAHDRLTVVGAAGATRLRVRATDGRTVLEHALRNGPTVELGALPAGLYTAAVFDAAGAVQVLRLVKQ